MSKYFKRKILFVFLFCIITFLFNPLFLTAENITNIPHFESWRISNITARSRSPKYVEANVNSREIYRYKFFYAISSGHSFIDWTNPDTKDWTLFSDSSSNIAIIKDNWKQYNGKYLLVKGEIHYGENKVKNSTHLTRNSFEYIDSMYIISHMQKEPAPGIDPNLKIETLTDKTHVYVQFYDRPKTWQKATELGVRLMDPGDGIYFTATLPVLKIDEIIQNELIRYIGPVLLENKISESIKKDRIGKWAVNADGSVNLWIRFYEDVSKEESKKLINRHNLKIEYAFRSGRGNYCFSIHNVPKEEIIKIAGEDIVMYIETVPPPATSALNESRPKINVDDVQSSPYNLNGSGVDVMVYEVDDAATSTPGLQTEIEDDHGDFDTRVTIVDSNGESIHATHVGGIIGGDGTASSSYKGIAPSVDLFSYSQEVGDVVSDLEKAIATHSVEISNNSWLYNVSCDDMGAYLYYAKEFDDTTVRATAPLIVVFAVGNERKDGPCGIAPGNESNNYKTVPPPATAKNIISVGATYSDNDGMTCFSNWGPLADGRIKPDVVAPGDENSDGDIPCNWGDRIKSTIPNQTYGNLAGTSTAAPHVTGALALMLQYYWSTHGGEANDDPLPSTMKAVLVHTAEDLDDGTSYYNIGPDYSSGYGRIDVLKAIQWIQKDNATDGIYILEGSITEGATDTFSFRVPSGQSLVKVTLVWDDEPGTASSTQNLRNDIDITLTDPNNNIKYPWTLDPDYASRPAVLSGPNDRDNIEQVYATSPTTGIWRLSVAGRDFYNNSATQSYSIVTDFPLGEPKNPVKDSVGRYAAIFGTDGNLYLKGSLFATGSGCSLSATADNELIIQDKFGNHQAIINSVTGNMCIAGTVYENQTSITNPATYDYIIQDYLGTIVARISDTGNMYLKGEVYQKAIP